MSNADYRPQREFTVQELHAMIEAGVLGEEEPLELLHGVLFVQSPQGPQHRSLTGNLRERLVLAYGPGFHVQDHSPVFGGDHSQPEPDVAVVRGSFMDFLAHHPGPDDIALLVEIAVSSQTRDLDKGTIYADAGYAHYWMLDVPARRLLAFSEPRSGGYRLCHTWRDDESVPVPGTDATLAVAELLP